MAQVIWNYATQSEPIAEGTPVASCSGMLIFRGRSLSSTHQYLKIHFHHDAEAMAASIPVEDF